MLGQTSVETSACNTRIDLARAAQVVIPVAAVTTTTMLRAVVVATPPTKVPAATLAMAEAIRLVATAQISTGSSEDGNG